MGSVGEAQNLNPETGAFIQKRNAVKQACKRLALGWFQMRIGSIFKRPKGMVRGRRRSEATTKRTWPLAFQIRLGWPLWSFLPQALYALPRRKRFAALGFLEFSGGLRRRFAAKLFEALEGAFCFRRFAFLHEAIIGGVAVQIAQPFRMTASCLLDLLLERLAFGMLRLEENMTLLAVALERPQRFQFILLFQLGVSSGKAIP